MNALRQVLYFSRASAALTDSDVRQILWISQRNNRIADITGCLLFSGRHFAQVLEGDSMQLDAALLRIGGDKRHSEIVLAIDHTVSVRRFSKWSMGVLFKADLTDMLEALIASQSVSDADALKILGEMNPDSLMGAL